MAQNLVKSENDTEQSDLARYLYDVALLQQGMLRGEALTEYPHLEV